MRNGRIRGLRLRFGLSSLLLFTVFVATFLGLVGRKFEQAKSQRNAVRMLGDVATVLYHHEIEHSSPSRAPAWLVETVGIDFFSPVEVIEAHAWNPRFTDCHAEYLQLCPHLNSLALLHQPITDSALRHVGQLTELKVLRLSETGVGDEGMECLSTLANLEELWLDDTLVTDRGIAALSALKRLRYLRLPRRTTDAGLAHLSGLLQLEEIDASHCTNITGAGIRKLECLPNLRKLSLSGFRWTDGDADEVPNFPKLEELSLGGTFVTPRAMQRLQKKLPNARIIAISGPNVDLTGEGLADPMWRADFFAKIADIRTLTLHEVHDEDLEHLVWFSRITTLKFSNTEITNDGLVHLKTMRNLRSLDLRETNVDDRGLVYLAPLLNLQSLCLSGDQIGLHLGSLPKLRALDLSHTDASDDDIEYLKHLTQLRKLNLYDTQISIAGYRQLCCALPACRVFYDDTDDPFDNEVYSEPPIFRGMSPLQD